MSAEKKGLNLQNIVEKTNDWYRKNEKIVLYAAIGLAVTIGGIYAFRYYQNDQNNEAMEELYPIQEAFAQDSLDIILKGTNGGMSAIEIADEYGSTKAGNLAKYYAAHAFFKKGDFKTALEYYKSFDGNGDLFLGPNRLGMIGNCYAALKDIESAASYFEKAGKEEINDLTTPHWMMKAGNAYEQLKKYDDAVDVYEFALEKCPKVKNENQVEKALSFAQARLGEYTDK